MKHTESRSSNTILVLKSLQIIGDIKYQDLIVSLKFPLGPARMDLREESSNNKVLTLVAFQPRSCK